MNYDNEPKNNELLTEVYQGFKARHHPKRTTAFGSKYTGRITYWEKYLQIKDILSVVRMLHKTCKNIYFRYNKRVFNLNIDNFRLKMTL